MRAPSMKKCNLFFAGVLFTSFLAAPVRAFGVTVLTGPSFTPAAGAPLAGLLQVTTAQSSRVSVSVFDGINTWQRNFYDYGTVHSQPLAGFKAGRTNLITVTVYDKFQNATTSLKPLVFITPPLPADLAKSVVIVSQPDKMEPGYTLFRLANETTGAAYVTIVDNQGQVVWYSATVKSAAEVRQLSNGDLFLPLTTGFIEVNLLGQIVQTWGAPSNLVVDAHEGLLTDQGTILYINDTYRVIPGFPTSATNPDAPTQTNNVLVNQIVEISATNEAVLNIWKLVDMLDPVRISYLTFTIWAGEGWDSEHANAIIEDPSDNSLIVSLRHQNAIIKFLRTGQLVWILGPPENWSAEFQPYLLTPVGQPFEWNYGQHAPVLTPQGTLLVYDNGNFRASPFDPFVANPASYSRAVEYEINEQTMEVSQVWDYGRTNCARLFTDQSGSATWLPQTGNVLIDFSHIMYINGVPPSSTAPNATMVRITEVTHDPVPEVVFDLAFFDYTNTNPSFNGYLVYRSHRIPDLYAHPAAAVADLTVTWDNGVAHLEFSADDTRTYTIEASTDLVNWEEIGVPSETGDGGQFSFDDDKSDGPSAVFYRVVTQ